MAAMPVAITATEATSATTQIADPCFRLRMAALRDAILDVALYVGEDSEAWNALAVGVEALLPWMVELERMEEA